MRRPRGHVSQALFLEAEAAIGRAIDRAVALAAFLMVGFGGGLRWGEITGLLRSDIDWPRQRVHVQRTWSEDGGRIEPCKDGEDRWVKLTSATMAALRAHCESMDLEGSLKR